MIMVPEDAAIERLIKALALSDGKAEAQFAQAMASGNVRLDALAMWLRPPRRQRVSWTDVAHPLFAHLYRDVRVEWGDLIAQMNAQLGIRVNNRRAPKPPQEAVTAALRSYALALPTHEALKREDKGASAAVRTAEPGARHDQIRTAFTALQEEGLTRKPGRARIV